MIKLALETYTCNSTTTRQFKTGIPGPRKQSVLWPRSTFKVIHTDTHTHTHLFLGQGCSDGVSLQGEGREGGAEAQVAQLVQVTHLVPTGGEGRGGEGEERGGKGSGRGGKG